MLAWIETDRGKPTIRFRQFDSQKIESLAADRPVSSFEWAADSQHILIRESQRGSEDEHLLVASLAHPEQPPVDRTPFPGVTMRSPQMLHDESPHILSGDPAHVLVLMNRRDASLFDLYRLDLETGALALVADNPGDVVRWVTDRMGTVIARMRSRTDGGWLLEVPDGTGWRMLLDGPADAVFTPRGVSRDGQFVWAVSSHGRDKAALVRLDLRSGDETVVDANADADVQDAWIDDDAAAAVSTVSCPDYCVEHYFDAGLARDIARFRPDGPAEVFVINADIAVRHLIVRVSTARAGDSDYLFDRQTGTMTQLTESPIARDSAALSPMTPVAFPARDGVALHGYLTLPQGMPGKNLPMVLVVHGGPWLRDYWGYDPMVQMLANRGYGVLSVNFRGSLGYGRAFLRASRHEFAGKMEDDVIDGARWAATQGLADPARIAIMGESYGGYATLMGLAVAPDVFAAGIDGFGPTDLPALLQEFPPYWKQRLNFWRAYVGDPADAHDRAEMASRSPINLADRIKRPLLIFQGTDDVRVGQQQPDRFVEAIRKAGGDVRLRRVPGRRPRHPQDAGQTGHGQTHRSLPCDALGQTRGAVMVRPGRVTRREIALERFRIPSPENGERRASLMSGLFLDGIAASLPLRDRMVFGPCR